MQARALAVTLCLAGAAEAGQPISESLVECSAIYDNAAGQMSERRAENAGRLLQAGRAYFDAAIKAAALEGRDDPRAYARAQYVAKCEKWGDMGLIDMVVREDVTEWFAYCRKLGVARGLQPLKGIEK